MHAQENPLAIILSFSNHSIKSLPKIFERVKTWLLLSLINKGKTEFILNN